MPAASFYPIIEDVDITFWNGITSYTAEMGVVAKNHSTETIRNSMNLYVLLERDKESTPVWLMGWLGECMSQLIEIIQGVGFMTTSVIRVFSHDTTIASISVGSLSSPSRLMPAPDIREPQGSATFPL